MGVNELERLPTFPDGGRASRWEHLRVDGRVARPLTLTAEDLAGLPQERTVEDFHCEEGWVVRAQSWEGVPVGEVLRAAEPLADARYLAFSSGKFTVSLTFEEARASNALLVLRLNGRPLAPGNGGPCRLVVAGKECYFSVKWLDRMEVSATRPAGTGREIALKRIRRPDAP